MEVKEIRNLTGLSQRAFAEKYKIPLQTLKQWESHKESKSYRKPPEYIKFLLGEVVQMSLREDVEHNNYNNQREFERDKVQSARINHTIRTAKDSRGNARLWLRYIAKHFENHSRQLTSSELRYLLGCDDLTMFQKCALKRAYQSDTPTHQYVVKLSQPCDTSYVTKLLERSLRNAE